MPQKIKKWNWMQKNKKKDKTKDEKEKKNKKVILLLLLLLVILLGILVGASFAKYHSKIETDAFAKIAKPVLEVRREQSLMLTALAPKASYVFEVRNYKEDELNQVEMEYYIEIISNTDEAINFALFKGDEEIPLNSNKTGKIKLTKEEKQTHSYRLEITYDNTKGKLGKDINENVEIKIHSIQKA